MDVKNTNYEEDGESRWVWSRKGGRLWPPPKAVTLCLLTHQLFISCLHCPSKSFSHTSQLGSIHENKCTSGGLNQVVKSCDSLECRSVAQWTLFLLGQCQRNL